MKKTPFLTLDKAKKIAAKIPTPFHIYDEAGIRRNARALKAAFAWNKGFREYFAVKELKIKGSKTLFADEKSYHALISVDGEAELTCHFCDSAYKFGKDELTELLNEATRE